MLDSQRVNETADLVVTTFNEREPLAGLNQAPPEEFYKFILNLTRQCADEELGFVVTESQTNKVIGAVLSSDLASSLNESDIDEAENHNPIESLITTLNDAYFTDEHLPENTYLSIKFVAMDGNYKGKGAVNQLISACLQQAKQKGFSYAQAEATGKISQHIFKNKLGFDEKAFIKYSDFTFDGETPFSPLTEHEGIKLLIKRL